MSLTKVSYSMITGASANILDFGTNTTPGTTDMAPALTAALATGKSVFIPAGTYKLASTVTLSGFEGQIIFGEGPTNTYIYTPTGGDAAFAMTSSRLVSLRDLAIFGVDGSSIGLLLGTRGVDPGGSGATFANSIRVNNVRFANCYQGIYIFGSNASSFRDCFFEVCTIGLYVQPVSVGDCNANNFDNMQFYGCGTAFQFLANADSGVNASENNFVGGLEACTTATFSVRGYANTFNLWVDSQNGAGAPTINTLDSNYYIIRNGGGIAMPTFGLSKVINFAGGNIVDQNAWLTKPAVNGGTVLDCTNGLSATIQNSQVFGIGDNAQVLIKNTNAAAQGSVLVQCLQDMPIGVKVTLVCAQNNTGIILQIPNNATWTYYGFANNDVIFGTVAVGTTYTILKSDSTTLVRLI
jgi:hypothetical protein